MRKLVGDQTGKSPEPIEECLQQIKGQIKSILLQNPSVEDCAVLVRRANTSQPELVIYIVSNQPLSSKQLQIDLQGIVPKTGLPITYIPLSSLPLNPSGEVDELALERLSTLEGGRRKRTRKSPSLKSLAISDGGLLPDDPNAPATLPEVLQRAARKFTGERMVYLNREGRETVQSYAELLEDASRILAGLKQLGLQPQEQVILQLECNSDIISAFWACLLGGFVPVILEVPPTYEGSNPVLDKLCQLWEFLDGPPIITDVARQNSVNSLSRRLKDALQVISLESLRNNAPDYWVYPTQPDDIALLTLSSGSTGMPKCIQLTHRNLISRARGANFLNQHQSHDVILNWLPFDHIGSLSDWHIRSLLIGCKVVYAPKDYILSRPFNWLDLIDYYRITHSWAPNFAYALINNLLEENAQQHWDLSCVQFLLSAGEVVSSQVMQDCLKKLTVYGLRKTAIRPAFGMAELGSGITYSGPIKATSLHFHRVDKSSLEGKIQRVEADHTNSIVFTDLGLVIPGVTIRIVDRENQILPEDTIGCLQVKGEAVFPGYYNHPQANQEAFLGDRWFNTGDLGFLCNGRLVLTGRAKETIIINGANYYSHEIEAVVETIEAVEVSYTAACAVRDGERATEKLAIFFHCSLEEEQRSRGDGEIGRWGDGGTRKPFSTFNPQPSTFNLPTEELLTLLKRIRRLVVTQVGINPDYLIPVAKEAIPKTAIGKIQRQQLSQRFEAGEFDAILKRLDSLLDRRESAQSMLTQTEIEQQIAHMWQEVIGLESVGIQENFFELGGHSLLLVQVQQRLEEAFGRQLALVDMFRYPTIAALAQYFSQQSTQTPATGQGQQRAKHRSQQQGTVDIAVIGMACRFPGADTLAQFWQNLCAGRESISFFTDEEILASGIDPELLKNRNYVKASPILSDVESFDAEFFGYSAKEAELIDPQQRLLLECAWESLEDAGYNPLTYSGSIGIYAGAAMNTYLLNNIYPNRDQLDPQESLQVTTLDSLGGFQMMVANDKDYLTTRVSYKLNLTGPSVNVQTACSTSLAAIHMASQSLLNGECDLVLAGGVSVQVPQKIGYLYQEGMIVSPDGHCRAFDAQARGTIFGNGVGLVVLKRLDAAKRDRDRIYAVIKGSAINNDGGTKVGYLAPNGEGQARVVAEAIAVAGVEAQTITYVEAHGTGTVLGDPIEMAGLTQAFRASSQEKCFCAIGSVKTNIGHLQIASGIAGFIKTVLSLHHQKLPASLHFEKPNPQIDFANSPFYVNTTLKDWQTSSYPRRAGVNSLGVGGTNVHVILEEALGEGKGAEEQGSRGAIERPIHLLSLSAKSESALRELVQRYETFLESHTEVSLADLCFTANTGRSQFDYRLAIAAASVEQLQESLKALRTGKETAQLINGQASSAQSLKIAFLFTGQGSQYPDMGRQLYETQPAFRATLDHCAEILKPYLEKPLLEILYPSLKQEEEGSGESSHCGLGVSPSGASGAPMGNRVRENSSLDSRTGGFPNPPVPTPDSPLPITNNLDETIYTQPALFALEYALAQLWMSWGITPSGVMGHSVGEYVAATIAGVFSLEDGLKLIAARGRLMQDLRQEGEMVSVLTDEARISAAIAPYPQKVAIAAINGPEHFVISGCREVLGSLIATLEAQGIKTKPLNVSHAFHSPLMKPMMAAFEKVAREVTYSPPRLDFISNLTGEFVTSEMATPEYWCYHVGQPVRFAASIATLNQQGYKAFLEIGPKPTLLGMGRAVLEGGGRISTSDFRLPTSDFLWLPSLRPGCSDWQQMLYSLGKLYVQGVKIDWSGFEQDYSRRRISLPTYPFQRQRYWIERERQGSRGAGEQGRIKNSSPLPSPVATTERTSATHWLRPSALASCYNGAGVATTGRESLTALPQRQSLMGETTPLPQLGETPRPECLNLGKPQDRAPLEPPAKRSLGNPRNALAPLLLLPDTSNQHHPLLGQRLPSALREILFQSHIAQDRPAFLNDHCVYQTVILPGAVYLEMALAAGAIVLKSSDIALEDVAIQQALKLSKEEQLVQLILRKEAAGASFEIYSQIMDDDAAQENAWRLHSSGKIVTKEDLVPKRLNLTQLQSRLSSELSVDTHYQNCQVRGIDYGLSLRAIAQLWGSAGEALGWIRLPEAFALEASTYHFHPVLLDACFQVVFAALPQAAKFQTYLPVGVERFRVYRRPGQTVWSYVQLRPNKDSHQESLIADLWLFDETGNLIAQVEGLSSKRASREALMGSDQLWQDWLYEVEWRTQEDREQGNTKSEVRRKRWGTEEDFQFSFNSKSKIKTGSWLILADESGIGEHLAARLREQQQVCILVFPGKAYKRSSEQFWIDVNTPADFQRLLETVKDEQLPLQGVIHLWSLDAPETQLLTGTDLELATRQGCGSVLHLIQALHHLNLKAPLWLVTQGAHSVELDNLDLLGVAQSCLWGMGKVIALEHPELNCVRVDLEPRLHAQEESAQALFEEIYSNDAEDQIAFRNGLRYVARLVRRPIQVSQNEGITIFQKDSSRLEITHRGTLDSLKWQPTPRRQPEMGEVEIQVRVTGLNFRDVLNALGLYPGNPGPLGLECAGEVIAIGPGVQDLRIGDAVVAIAPGSFSQYVTVAATLVVPKPDWFSFEEAATIPGAFLTAYYTLHHLAKIKPGDRVLIHAAAGGVGLAAVQLAQQAGAEVFATASPDKWEYLKSLGVKHLMNSRTLAFADEVMALTQSKGVDIVLNSLAGEFIPKSLSVLSPQGCFLEIGKQGVWESNQVAQLKPDASYFLIDLVEVMQQQPALIQSMLRHLMQQLQVSQLKPLPHQVFPGERVVDAFRYMAGAKHIGKVVISLEDREQGTGSRGAEEQRSRKQGNEVGSRKSKVRRTKFNLQPSTFNLQPSTFKDSTYLITGGLGELGLLMAQWLVEKGAKHLVLVGRSEANDAVKLQLGALEQAGVKVVLAQADVADAEQVSQVLTKVERTLPPLRGIIHAAGVLDDGVLQQLSWERFERVIAPKVQGAWNLHTLSQNYPLDFFILFSSVASLLGSAGQANYSAANAFLDALAYARRAKGLPGLSINWGAWSQVGVAAKRQMDKPLGIKGMGSITPQQGLAVLEELLFSQPPIQIGVVPLDWSQWQEQIAAWPFLTDFKPELTQNSRIIGKGTLLQQLERATPNERQTLLLAHVCAQVAKVLGLPASTLLESQQGLSELGVDSLTSVELRNCLQGSLGCTLPSTLAFDYPTVSAIADYLVQKLFSPTEDLESQEDREEGNPTVTEIQQLSEAEAEALLLDELENLESI